MAVLHRGMDLPGKQTDDEFRPAAKTRRKYPCVLPKYRNPQSPTETWSGRGKLPRWLVVATENGRRIEEFRIVDETVPLPLERPELDAFLRASLMPSRPFARRLASLAHLGEVSRSPKV